MISRLAKEKQECLTACEENFSVGPDPENPRIWHASIFGVPGPYQRGVFDLEITLPEKYPFHPPTVKFKKPIYHPNISFSNGSVCIDVIKSNWTSGMTIKNVLRCIVSLLNNPNADSPLNSEAAKLYKENPVEYQEKIRRLTIKEFN